MTKIVYLDITEFIRFPVRTGLQRVVRELIKAWPKSCELVPVKFCLDGCIRRVSMEAVSFAVDYVNAAEMTIDEAISEIHFLDFREDVVAIDFSSSDRVLIPELFFDQNRIRFYHRAVAAGVDVSIIVPDFLLWLQPHFFNKLWNSSGTIPYLLLLKELKKRAFISQEVKRQFELRILRREAGHASIVIDLGADGLPIRKQKFHKCRKELICLGTLQVRKAQNLVYEAFCKRDNNGGLKLTFVGDISYHADDGLKQILNNDRPDVRLIRNATDSEVVALFDDARASIYPATAEGYGLPPMESLWAGVPAIVNGNLPAIEGKPALGQIRLENTSVRDLREAFDKLADDAYAEDLWSAAADYPSITWSMTAEQVVEWVLA